MSEANIKIRWGRHGLSHLLTKGDFPVAENGRADQRLKSLKLKMLRIQQGLWHCKRRAIVVFEGFDAAGKGGCIRRLTEPLDPRGVQVHPIAAPQAVEQGKHYLYRFWKNLPAPGSLAIFDRSWYGRVLVERVEKLTPESRWREAFSEINQFEAMLRQDGIDLVKIFLAIHPDEQLRRFKDRLQDPYKQWKLTSDDLNAHRNWEAYVRAGDEMLFRTNTPECPWHVIPADSKEHARREVLRIVTRRLGHHGSWMEETARGKNYRQLRDALKKLERMERHPSRAKSRKAFR